MSFEVQLIEFISFQSGPLLSSLDTGTIEYWALPESNSLKTKWREKKKKKKKKKKGGYKKEPNSTHRYHRLLFIQYSFFLLSSFSFTSSNLFLLHFYFFLHFFVGVPFLVSFC